MDEKEIEKWKGFDSVFLREINDFLQILLKNDKTQEERTLLLDRKLFDIVMYIHKNTELKK